MQKSPVSHLPETLLQYQSRAETRGLIKQQSQGLRMSQTQRAALGPDVQASRQMDNGRNGASQSSLPAVPQQTHQVLR